MRTLIRNGIGFWPADHAVRPMHILAEGDTIREVSATDIPSQPDMAVFDVRGSLLLPGFVDAHTHLSQSFGRGIYDNLPLTQWLLHLTHIFRLSEEDTYLATLVGCLEALKSGTTTVAEMTSIGANVDASAQAIADSGLRAVLCTCIGDFQEGGNPPPSMDAAEALAAMRQLHERWHGQAGGRITVRVSPVGLPACTEKFMRGSRALADELHTGIHTHCCEGRAETAGAYERFGCSEVEALHRFGVLGPDAQLVHCVWLTEADMDIIAETGSHVVHCPSTNCKITDGVPPMPSLFRRGVNIALGCDGAASSGSYDMFKEARLAALLAKVTTDDATVFTARETLAMMTANGARAVGLADQVGTLEVGRKADITVVQYPQVHLVDERRLLSNLVYGAAGGDVEAVFVGGRPLMWQRRLVHLDEADIASRAQRAMRSARHILPG